jgi:predicted acyltransferase (DUF342 family)
MRRQVFIALVLLALAAPVSAQTGASPHDASIDTVSALTLDSSLQEIPPHESGIRPGAAVLLLLGFSLLIVLPFIPGLIEVYWPRDRYPLPVDTSYAKDPRYFGIAARRILADALDIDGVPPGAHEAVMSKPETIVVADTAIVPENGEQAEILVARGELTVGEQAVCSGELFARDAARIGRGALIRTLSCESDVRLEDAVRLERWLDAEGDVFAGDTCDLGVSASAAGTLTIGDRVRFSRLFGAPVTTTGFTGDEGSVPPPALPAFTDVDEIRTIEDLAEFHRDDLVIAAGEEHPRPLVVRGDLTVESGGVLGNSARVYGDLRLEDDTVVHGDLFVEGDVHVGERAIVRGNLFSQARIDLSRGARIGCPGLCKSLIGKREIRLAADVAVHGYIQTDGRGHVSCAGSS